MVGQLILQTEPILISAWHIVESDFGITFTLRVWLYRLLELPHESKDEPKFGNAALNTFFTIGKVLKYPKKRLEGYNKTLMIII